MQLTNILISSFFSVATLGFYSLVQKILGMPSALIGSSIGQVFFQEASEAKKKDGNALNVYKRTIKKLLIIGIFGFGILFFLIEDIFTFVFGEKWRVAGEYAQIVIPFFLVRFIFASTSSIYDIFNALKIELIWQIVLVIGIILILFIFKDSGFKTFLTYMTIYGVLMYSLSLYITFQLSKGIYKYGK